MTSKLPDKVSCCFCFLLSFFTYKSSHIGNQNWIFVAERYTVPDSALTIRVMFSFKSEYMISNPEKPLQMQNNVKC